MENTRTTQQHPNQETAMMNLSERIGKYRITMTDPTHHEPGRVKVVNGKSFAVRADFVVLGFVEAKSLKEANLKAKAMHPKASAEFIRLVKQTG